MGTIFKHCPANHSHKGGWLALDIYECKECGQCYCPKCGDRCPNCGAKDKRKVGIAK